MNFEQQLLQWFTHFHTHAEISWKEIETTKKIAEMLTEWGVSYRLFDDVPGLVAEIGTGEFGVAVRADIDALWQELDGVWQANHSCGHDANMTMVLGALYQLKDVPLNHRIRFIFQPAEEMGNGAVAAYEHGAVENIQQLYGIHLRPIDEIPFGKVTAAMHHGAAYFLTGTIQGVDAHGARPHQGKNAIDVIMAIQQMLTAVHVSPFIPHSAKLTKIVADGGSVNIIPGAASFSMDVRAQNNETLEQLHHKIEHGLVSIRQQYDIELNWDWIDYTPGAVVNQVAADHAAQSIMGLYGQDALAPHIYTPGSDDFHFYTVKQPKLQATMIGIGADLSPGLHHPYMKFDHRALKVGADVLTETLKTAHPAK